MKTKTLLLVTFTVMFLGSCTLTKRYHSMGYQVEWKNNKNIVTQVKKNNPIAVRKLTTPLLANKSLGEISNSEDELPNRAKTNILQSLPFETNSFVRLININKTNTKSILPPDSAKIVKIANLRLKMKSRFKRLESTTLFTILTLKIIDFFDGDDSDWSNAYVFALLFFVYLWILLLFIALITWVVYQIKKLSYYINH